MESEVEFEVVVLELVDVVEEVVKSFPLVPYRDEEDLVEMEVDSVAAGAGAGT